MAGALPLGQAVDEYLSWLELDRQLSKATVEAYRGDLDQFLEFAGAERPLSDIDRDLIRAWQRRLAQVQPRGSAYQDRRLAPSTRKRRLVALRNFLRFASREEWLPGDLGTTIDLPRLPERLPKPLQEDGRERLLTALPADTLEHKRDRALILFLLSTGCRISEVLRLDREEWRPHRMTVIGKGDRERAVMVTDRAREAVDDYLEAREDASPALFIGFQPARKTATYNRLTRRGAGHVCQQLALRLGVPRFHPHQLRHTLGTLLQETVGDARLTAETLGHRGLGSVAGYTKITDARRRQAYEQMEKAGL